MAVIDYIDGLNRRIYLHADTANAITHPMDIYREMRILRRTNETLRKYDVFLRAYGNIKKTDTKNTERYVMEMDGTRIIPYDITSSITINGTIITDDGQEGLDCFDKSSLVNCVDINYFPPQVEVIEVNTGSGITEQDKQDIADLTENQIMPYVYGK